ncbi:DEAD/DEAH box helicase, partial [Alicyclobacillus sp.]|uniref:DEAD/DEAH box helicase n=1 Tax=Alicyclobacillus sp. TaxID=61169 RepID=UPI0025C48B28
MRRADELGMRLHGRVEAPSVWWQSGAVRMWLSGGPEPAGRDALADWIRGQLGPAEDLEILPSGVRMDASAFLRVLPGVADAPWGLAEDLEVCGRAVGLAMAVIRHNDVLPFAAPRDLPAAKLWETLLRLAQPGDLGFSEWESGAGRFMAAWMPAWRSASLVDARMALLSQAERWWQASEADGPDAAGDARQVCDLWLCRCVDHLARRALRPDAAPLDSAQGASRVPYRGEAELLARFGAALTGSETGFSADGWLLWRALRRWFADSGWRTAPESLETGSGRYGLEVAVEPRDPAEDWFARLWIRHLSRPAVRVPLADWWRRRDGTVWIGGEMLRNPDIWLLPQLLRAAQVWPSLAEAMRHPAPRGCRLPADDVYPFLMDVAPKLEAAGVSVRWPDLQRMEARDVRIRVRVRQRRRSVAPAAAGRERPWFDRLHLAEFDWTLAVGDQVIPLDTFLDMVRRGTPFLRTESGWRWLPLKEILERVEGVAPLREDRALPVAVRAWLWAQEDFGDGAVDWSFHPSATALRDWLQGLRGARHPRVPELPAGFRGTLRAYQRIGYGWMVHLRGLGLGGVLADDMGLGKTVQVLAYLQHLKESRQARGPHLLICPTSLVTNWRQEAARFTPGLRLYVHHGAGRHEVRPDGQSALEHAAGTCDVILTTYATAVRDLDALGRIEWDVGIADEAQAIKNPDTRQARTLRHLSVHQWIALTGTPVENRLVELWSIVQLVNPGYLGGARWFRRTFAEPIARQPEGPRARQLRALLQPILLRRSKQDPDIRRELPDKWEIQSYAALTPEQAALYQGIVDELFRGLDRPGSMTRRGQILTALTRLKQVCDHPALVAGGRTSADRSGKLTVLLERMEEVLGKGEAALVFTQFRAMGELLVAALRQRFGWTPPFLHGGVGAARRGELVARFQQGVDPAPVFILSLKAGGVGLNLTRANHVFHFDRWWNPAVEDQATDRVFRIGQSQQVQVHRILCP